MYGRFYEMNKRDSQRANRKAKEERLNRTTEWGSADQTARQAVDNIIAEQKAMAQAARTRVKAKSVKAKSVKRTA